MAAPTKVTTPSKSPTLPVLFLLITLGILIAGGYFVYQTVNKNQAGMSPLSKVAELTGGNALPQVTENDFSFVDDPLVRKHFAAQANQHKFKVTSTSDGRGSGEETVSEVEYKGADNFGFHTMMTSGGKETTNMIVLGDTTYIKDQKDGVWWMEKAKPDDSSKQAQEANVQEPENFKDEYTQKTKMEYKKLGEEACPGMESLKCYKYLETDNNTVDSPQRTFWFDTQNLLLRKEISGQGEFTATNLYSYDNISVTAPSPTKPVPAGKSIYDMMVSGMMGESGMGSNGSMPNAVDQQKMMDQLNSLQQQYGGDTPEAQDSNSDYSNDSGY